jgi:hypothetical protein
MADGFPTIWSTDIGDPMNMRNIDFHCPENPLQSIEPLHVIRHRISTDLRDGLRPVPPEEVPDYIYFDLRDVRKSEKANLPDLFKITGGIPVVSERFRELLMAHDLGATEFHEVPLFEYDQTTRRPGRWFLLSIIESKPTLIPEKSEGIRETAGKGVFAPVSGVNDVLAVHAESAAGADLWQDRAILFRIFLSDRLKRAINDAGIKVRRMPMRKCVVVAAA